MRAFIFGVCLGIGQACAPPGNTKQSEEGTTPATTGNGCDPLQDADADGLDDCAERDLGTDPLSPDSDGDGSSDAAELSCGADALDADERCYACGWMRGDPGNLSSTGAEVGDVVANLSLVDQCGESVDLWDFAGPYTVVFLTAAWCPNCKEEAASLASDVAALADRTGAPAHGLIVLFESRTAGVPSVDDAVPYAEEVGAVTLPVLADVHSSALSALPYDGRELPGVCLLSPSMEILSCGSGQGQVPGLADQITSN